MKVVVAPDSFGGTLTALEAARAIEAGWHEATDGRDEVVRCPLSDGGEGLLDVLDGTGTRRSVEVAGPLGRPRVAEWLLRPDGTAVVESARACGLALVPETRRDPADTTTYGVGQLLRAARDAGAARIMVGLGGSATVDGGAGALAGLGFRVLVADGSGLKIGAADLPRAAAVRPGWEGDWSSCTVELLADVETALPAAARTFGPQKGAGPDQLAALAAALDRWADVVEDDLDCPGLRHQPRTGAAGGLAFGLAAALGAPLRSGADEVAALVGLAGALEGADLVITGEGRLDETSAEGKVVGAVIRHAAGVPVAAIVGGAAGRPSGLAEVVEAAPDGPGDDPAADLAAAARRLADGRS